MFQEKQKKFVKKTVVDLKKLETAENLNLIREIFRENDGKPISGADFGNKLLGKKPKELWGIKDNLSTGLLTVFSGILVKHRNEENTNCYIEFREEECEKYFALMEKRHSHTGKQMKNEDELSDLLDKAKNLIEHTMDSGNAPEALRAILYAFVRKSVTLSELYPLEYFNLCNLESDEYEEKKYLGNLTETFKLVLQREEYTVIDACGQVICKLCKYVKDADITTTLNSDDGWTEKNLSNKPEQQIVENCLANFNEISAWSLLTKYYHEAAVYSMRDAGNLFEKIKFSEEDEAQTYILTTLERSLERVTAYFSHSNFLLNQRHHLEKTEEHCSRKLKERTDKYWEEYINQIRRTNCFVNTPEYVADSYYEYACGMAPKDRKYTYDSIGGVTYSILEQRKQDIHSFLQKYQEGCRMERYLFHVSKEKGKLKYKHNAELFRFMVICLLRDRGEKENEEIAKKVQCLYEKCDSSKFDTSFGVMFTKLGELLERKEGSIKEEALRLMLERFPKAPKVIQLYNACGIEANEVTGSYLDTLNFCCSVYPGHYEFYKELYMALRNYLGGTFAKESTPELESLRERIMDMILYAAKHCMSMSNTSGKISLDDRSRFWRMIYALVKLSNVSQEEAKEYYVLVDALASREEKEQLVNFRTALQNLMENKNISEGLRKQIVLCGITNYWDYFVQDIPSVSLAMDGKDKKSATICFNEYLKQIDYRAFRRCVLQKIAELATVNDQRTIRTYKFSSYFSDDASLPTAVLLSASRHIGGTVSAEDEVLLSVLTKTLEKNCKYWNVLESYIPGFYVGQSAKMQEEITEMLGAIISGIYNTEDIINLLHSMSCSKINAKYALRLLGNSQGESRIYGLEKELDPFCLNYYRTIAYAVTGETELARALFESEIRTSADVDHSRMIEKLYRKVICKMDRETFAADRRVLLYGLQENELLKLRFMEPVKADTNLYVLLKRFLETNSAEIKCQLAPQIYYWLLYSEETLGIMSYQEFLLAWAYAELDYEESERDKLQILDELRERVEKGQLLSEAQKVTDAYQNKEVIFKTLLSKLNVVLDKAVVIMPSKQTKLRYADIKIADWSAEKAEELYETLRRKCSTEQAVIPLVFDILKRNLTDEVILSQKLTELKEESLFAGNILHALYIRGNGGLEFTVLNREDETEPALFYQVKNISGRVMKQIGMQIRIKEEEKPVIIGDYCIQSLNAKESAYGSVELSEYRKVWECLVVFYDGTPENVLCSFDTSLLDKEKSGLEEIQSQSLDNCLEKLNQNLKNKRHSFLVYDDKKLLEKCIATLENVIRLDFSESTELSETFVNEKLAEVPEGSLVFWYSYWHDIKKNWTEDIWNSFYRYNEKNCSIVFCYFSQNVLSEEIGRFVSSMGNYMKLVSLKPTWLENFRRREYIHTGKEIVFTDESLECLKACSEGDVAVANRCLDKLLDNWISERCYVYPSDILQIAGNSRIEEVSTEECTALVLRPNASAEDMISDFVTYLEAYNLPKDRLEIMLMNSGLIAPRKLVNEGLMINGDVDTVNQDIIKAGGTKVENNIQVFNCVQQIFNQYMLPDTKEEKEAYDNLFQEHENLKEKFDEALKQSKQQSAQSDARIEEILKKLTETESELELLQQELENTSTPDENISQRAEDLSKERNKLEEEYLEYMLQTDQTISDLKEQLQEKEFQLEQVRAEKEEQAHQSISEMLKTKLKNLVEKITMEDKRNALFPQAEPEDLDVLTKMLKEAGMLESFNYATFVHFLFWFLSELSKEGVQSNGQPQGELDFAPVSLMYAKLYEGLLKSQHFSIYKAKLSNVVTNLKKKDANDNTILDPVTRKPVYYKFGELADDSKLTIGSFSFPLSLSDGSDHVQNITKLSTNSRGNCRQTVKKYWKEHKDAMIVIQEIRNDTAHGSATGAKIEKSKIDELVKLLIMDKTSNGHAKEGDYFRLLDLKYLENHNDKRSEEIRRELTNN